MAGAVLGIALALLAPAIRPLEPAAIAAPSPVISVSPLMLKSPGRGENLQVRISAPLEGRDLPIIIFAHGNGSSSEAYAPLVSFWAGHGFVVIQPTFLDSKKLALAPNDPRTPRIWMSRVEDVRHVLDHLDVLEASVPGLKGRVDRTRIAIVGHSYGGITASMLLGARVIQPNGALGKDLTDPRIKAGVLLSTAGRGGKDLSAFAAAAFPFIDRAFDGMKAPVLVVAGDKDVSRLTVRGPDWFTDSYVLSSGAKCLLTLFGGEHMLGGISGYDVRETTDENPKRVAAVQTLSWSYLRTALYPGDPAWPRARAALAKQPDDSGRIACK